MENFATLAKAVSDPNRLRTLKILESGELCVCQITAVLGLATPTVSAHLAVLRRAGLIEQRRDGRWIHYRLARPAKGSAEARLLALAIDALAGAPQTAVDQDTLARVCAVPVESLCAPGAGAREVVNSGKRKEPA